MSLLDVIEEDMTRLFFNGDFDEAVTYTPQGLSGYSIRAHVIYQSRRPIFNEGNNVKDYDEMQIAISARNNTEGRVTPKEVSRKGQVGDTITVGGVVWYVREISTRARLYVHVLSCTDKLFPFGDWGR